MNDLLVQNEIGSRIFTLRGKEVMIDRDLAELYGVETKVTQPSRKKKHKAIP